MKDSVVAYTDIIYKAIDADEKIEFRFFHYTSGLDRPKEYRNGGKPITVSPFACIGAMAFTIYTLIQKMINSNITA